MPWHLRTVSGETLAQSDALSPCTGVRHGVTVRAETPEASNYSFGVAPDPDVVVANRRRVCLALGFEPHSLIVPGMMHSANVVVVDEGHRGRGGLRCDTALSDCDALVTRTPGLLLGVTGADCLPVLLVDPVQNVIAVAHSGWRGTAARIVVHTLATMNAAFGVQATDCIVAIGPGIGPEGYEVDARVHSAFCAEDAAAPEVFVLSRPGHWLLDLTAAVRHQLQSVGVRETQIDVSPWRTDRHTDLFFSHRLSPGCPRLGAFLGLVPSSTP